MFSPQPFRLAVIGSGPAGVYAAETLARTPQVKSGELTVECDIFDALPTPFGLIRYGVAPDHPRIKGIITALHRILGRGDIRFLGDVEFGRDVTLEELRERYDAIVLATGALKDARLEIPGIDLEGSFGAADFVAWYDGNPDYPRTWPLTAQQVAMIGNGNVALHAARQECRTEFGQELAVVVALGQCAGKQRFAGRNYDHHLIANGLADAVNRLPVLAAAKHQLGFWRGRLGRQRLGPTQVDHFAAGLQIGHVQVARERRGRHL